MNTAETEEVLLSDEEFEALEAVLVSDDVPADCMNLEMLDGYVAALVCSPERIAMARWLRRRRARPPTTTRRMGRSCRSAPTCWR